jgi:hypothetical protein
MWARCLAVDEMAICMAASGLLCVSQLGHYFLPTHTMLRALAGLGKGVAGTPFSGAVCAAVVFDHCKPCQGVLVGQPQVHAVTGNRGMFAAVPAVRVHGPPTHCVCFCLQCMVLVVVYILCVCGETLWILYPSSMACSQLHRLNTSIA